MEWNGINLRAILGIYKGWKMWDMMGTTVEMSIFYDIRSHPIILPAMTTPKKEGRQRSLYSNPCRSGTPDQSEEWRRILPRYLPSWNGIPATIPGSDRASE